MGLENDFDADKDVVEEDMGMENDVGATADKDTVRLEEHPVFVGLILLVFYGHDSDISVVTPECMLFCEYQMWTSPVPVVASITSSLV
ncbi:hypothetical protein MKW92_008142 [Papaver armeniacum]|nr:hypothetical protein MKW92_008142 [Papaver armeniacum]